MDASAANATMLAWTDERVVCKDPFVVFIGAFYWSVMTVTSIGYGDIAASGDNPIEQGICALMMLAGGVTWGLVIAELCSVVSSINADSAEFNKTMDSVNQFVRTYRLVPEVSQRLRDYFYATKHLRNAAAHRELLMTMSPALQSEVMWLVHRPWLERVHFLRNAPRSFMAELAICLEAIVCAPGEVAPQGYLYVVQSGIVLFGGRVLTAGKVWGLDSILSNEELRSTAVGRAMTYVEVYRISGAQLIELASHLPQMHTHMRWCAIKLAIHRYIVKHANFMLAKRSYGHRKGSFLAMLDHSSDTKEMSEMSIAANLAQYRTHKTRLSRTSTSRPSMAEASETNGALERLLVAQGEAMEEMRREHRQTAEVVGQLKAMLEQVQASSPLPSTARSILPAIEGS